MEMELIDDGQIDNGACAAADLAARLHAELSQAQAHLALTVARGMAVASTGKAVPAEIVGERLMAEQKIEVLRGLLDGMPGGSVDLNDPDGGHRASA